MVGHVILVILNNFSLNFLELKHDVIENLKYMPIGHKLQ